MCQFLSRLLYVVGGQSCQDPLCILFRHIGQVTVDLCSKCLSEGDAAVLQGEGEVQGLEVVAVHVDSIGPFRGLLR